MRALSRVYLVMVLLVFWSSLTMAFETPPVIDTCHRIENPLASGWAGKFDPDDASTWLANGTACVVLSGGGATYWNTLYGPNLRIAVQLTDATTTSTNSVRLGFVQQPSAVAQTVDGYRCGWQPALNNAEIRRITNGSTGTLISSAVTLALTSGDWIGCQKMGDTISLWHSTDGVTWTMRVSVQDSTYTGQFYPSLDMSSTALAIDNISFANVLSTRLGIHHTAEEVELWQARALTDPEYTTILNNADDWVTAPDARWAGQVAATCWNDTIAPPGRRTDSGLTDAAFVYLLTGDTSYRTPVLVALLAQAALPGTNFADTTRWCLTRDGTDGIGDDIGPWIKRLVYAYSYIRDTVSGANQAILDPWFSNIATWISRATSNNVKKSFPNRDLGDYSGCTTGGFCPGISFGFTHFGGFDVRTFHIAWSNQPASAMSVVAAIGALLNDPTHLFEAKRFFKEWLAYGVFPGGVVMDQYRWNGGNPPQNGYGYEHLAIGSMISIAEHVARLGDTELYTYSTTTGLHGTAGSPAKSLLSAMQHVAGLTNGTILEYASTTSTSDPNLLIDQNGPLGVRVSYIYLAPGNIYYQDPAVHTAYSLPTGAYNSIGCDEDPRGEWCNYPGVRFMFGQMEGLVWPYTLEGALAPVPLPGILLLPAPTQVGSIRQGGALQGGTRQ